MVPSHTALSLAIRITLVAAAGLAYTTLRSRRAARTQLKSQERESEREQQKGPNDGAL